VRPAALRTTLRSSSRSVTVLRSAPSERISSIGRMIDWKSGIATWRGCSILRPNTLPNGAVVCSRYRCQERLRPPVQLADPVPRIEIVDRFAGLKDAVLTGGQTQEPGCSADGVAFPLPITLQHRRERGARLGMAAA
jgi:hypothetical protein